MLPRVTTFGTGIDQYITSELFCYEQSGRSAVKISEVGNGKWLPFVETVTRCAQGGHQLRMELHSQTHYYCTTILENCQKVKNQSRCYKFPATNEE